MKNATAPDPDELTPEERREALADVLAEGFLYLVDSGLVAKVLGDGEAGDDHAENNTEKPSQNRLAFRRRSVYPSLLTGRSRDGEAKRTGRAGQRGGDDAE